MISLIVQPNKGKFSLSVLNPEALIQIDDDKETEYLEYDCEVTKITDQEIKNAVLKFSNNLKQYNGENQILKDLYKETLNCIDSNYANLTLNSIDKEYIINIDVVCTFLLTTKLECKCYLDLSESKNITLDINNVDKKIKLKAKNLYVKYQQQSDYTQYYKLKKMHDKMNGIIELLKASSLSPMEQVMYVYDIAKSFIYKDNEDNVGQSRNLCEVLESDYIVCVGYSNFIEYILKQLGIIIESPRFIYDNKERGHQRNLIYLKDDKYDIDGLFFLDATWDRKKTEQDDNYLTNYTYFLYSTIKQSKKEHFESNLLQVLELSKKQIEEIFYSSDTSKRTMTLLNMNIILNKKNNVSDVIQQAFLKITNYSGEQFKIDIEEFEKYRHSLMNIEIFIKCLYNVRNFQFEQGKIKQPLTTKKIDQIMIQIYQEMYILFKGECHEILNQLENKKTKIKK